MDAEERASLKNQLRAHKRRRDKRLEQRARLGPNRDPQIDIDIEDAEADILRIEQILTGAVDQTKRIQDKQQEMASFRAMLSVIESVSASHWIFSSVADTLGDRTFLTPDVTVLIIKKVRDRCLERIATLEKELAELAPINKIFVEESPRDIYNWYKLQPKGVERERQWRYRYQGKYMQVSDQIKSFSAAGSFVDIILDRVSFTLDIDDPVVDSLEVGKLITVSGMIYVISPYPDAITLVECQIIDK